ncbi:unnamed protein product [Natator depressus]
MASDPATLRIYSPPAQPSPRPAASGTDRNSRKHPALSRFRSNIDEGNTGEACMTVTILVNPQDQTRKYCKGTLGEMIKQRHIHQF